MKKKYIIPAERVALVQPMSLMATSIPFAGDTEDPADPDYTGGGDAKEEIFSGKDLWDEEW